MDKVSAMHGLAVQAHREKYKSHTRKYDVDLVTHLVEQIQALAGDKYSSISFDVIYGTPSTLQITGEESSAIVVRTGEEVRAERVLRGAGAAEGPGSRGHRHYYQ